jgi:predicted nucleic acid-binding Zn ribbon protein
MERTCIVCNKPLTGRQRKCCSSSCHGRAWNNAKRGKPLDAWSWIPQDTCPQCGKSTENRAAQAKYCSKRCRWDASHKMQKARAQQQKRMQGLPIPGDMVPCDNPQCFNAAIYVYLRAFCSDDCQQYVQRNKHWLGDGPSTRIHFHPCPDCSRIVLRRSHGGSSKPCTPCRVIRNKAMNARKNHARRVAGEPVLSVNEIAERDGCRCHICHRKVDMSLSGKAKWGPTIEHIVPVSQGGTNDPGNLALAHRYCNTARGNRGHSQLLLVA